MMFLPKKLPKII